MIDLQQTDEGVLLPVRVQPRARHNAIMGIHGGRIKVAVTQAPEKGKANVAVVKVLAKALGVNRSHIILKNGATSQQKVLLISGMEPAELRQRLSI